MGRVANVYLVGIIGVALTQNVMPFFVGFICGQTQGAVPQDVESLHTFSVQLYQIHCIIL